RVWRLPGADNTCLAIGSGYNSQSVRGACALNDGGNGFGQDFDIEAERPLVDVLHIQLHPLVEVDGAAPVDLPQAGDARADAEAAAVPVLIESLVITLGKRPGAHQAHIAL